MNSRPKVGIDLAPIGYRHRAPGTAMLVENQARALLSRPVAWDWVVVATPRTLQDSPDFKTFHPIVVPDAPLSYHGSWRVGRIWSRAGCALGFATTFFAPLIGPPVVTNQFDANAFHPVRDFHDARSRLKSLVVQGLWKLSRNRSRALFILSEYGRARMIKVDPRNASKWVVTPCGIPEMALTATQPPSWAQPLKGRPFILYAGAISENKNQRRLIAAWDELRRQRADFPSLILIGPGPSDYLHDIIEPAIARTACPGEILMPGFVSREDVVWAFRAAHAYIQPSFAEGFGMPVLEAMSCGIPTACSNSTSLPEVAGDAAILFDPSNIQDMANALQMVVSDETLRTRLRTAGFERCKLFTWARNAELVARRIQQELAIASQH